MSEEQWIDKVKSLKINIENLEPKDRLEYISSILHCLSAIVGSCNGWRQWVTNPILMNKFTEDQLEEIFNFFKEISSKTLEDDLKWTQLLKSKEKVKSEDKITYRA